MSAALFVLLEIGVALGVWRLADRARKQQLKARTAALFAGGCAVLLLLLIATDWPLTDWPSPAINAFWDEHGVLAGTVQSVLLFGVGLLSYEAGQLRAQERLDESVTAAGLGGIVDHVVDVEVGLAFLSSSEPPDAHGWAWSPGRPLQWLRQGRQRLSRAASDRTGDPRTWLATLPDTDDPKWREAVDQCIRRLLVALRDWTPIIATSRNGTRVLVAIAGCARTSSSSTRTSGTTGRSSSPCSSACVRGRGCWRTSSSSRAAPTRCGPRCWTASTRCPRPPRRWTGPRTRPGGTCSERTGPRTWKGRPKRSAEESNHSRGPRPDGRGPRCRSPAGQLPNSKC